jgi:hypothetical protein
MQIDGSQLRIDLQQLKPCRQLPPETHPESRGQGQERLGIFLSHRSYGVPSLGSLLSSED